ncbi:MAG TPA: YcnI family protein [Pseudonocardiaceae bacterium]|jgi:uncharacterized protein YcnI|nr:YcnI family protein [Pseudonocardiaceae bacterium]
MSTKKFTLRAAATVTTAGALVLVTAGIASAHVSAHSPDNPAKGGDAEIVFRVPDEQATAHNTSLTVNMPTTTPITNADIKPVPGWTAQETMFTLAKPISIDNETVTTAVKSITWTSPKGQGIAPGQFQEFPISVEGLPDNTDKLVFTATQIYDNGVVVNWNQPVVPGKPEPEHPMPTLALAAASADDDAAPAPAVTANTPPAAAPAPTSDGTARTLGIVGIVLAALALGFGAGAFVRGRRDAGAQARSKAGASA